MRLVCPNCGAEYEVPAEVIPEEGRDVQCSNCGDTWYQEHPEHPGTSDQADDHDVDFEDNDVAEPEPASVPHSDPKPEPETPAEQEAVPSHDVVEDAPEPEPAEEPEPEPTAAAARELDPAVASILREEADLEERVRASESSGLESQPDLGLEEAEDEATRRAREVQTRMARMRGEESGETEDNIDAAVAAAALGSRRDLLPDIEEINSTLRSTSDRQLDGDEVAETAPQRARAKRGFRRGFLLMLLLAALAVILYNFAPKISDMVPALDPLVSSYVTFVDQLRNWLGGQVTGALQWLDTQASNSSPNG